ncbi:16S rRNA (adenine1518-N6/adenine1519-N6)-dimethyltransferase [Acetitomaculum ruminis DSM 5522]|uniref:Ribosomal RNA small subunit methyltransferase A n=1 Tax=Acetitomaculum ruminis DSM 5522 TaxID=1120918 RepID=A0A1I0ZAM1_9FIRM|nr:16S rRNA (adenine(1518)-N(6)/adenine(1519)-N(6))-dimethyltransferase RsmA [Acetitomaculum ruminis]SFB22809.1 16S rRNA (adenine1518-N6/adenine1519-N6)-dimethyltransferase [Acetitomaculum ruminis DSM 5522]
MAYLANPTKTLGLIKRYGFNFRKDYGQNFLIDANILETIVEKSEITKDDCVLEIGPGIGTMTQYLCEAAGKVIAVELDKALLPILDETLAEYKNVEIINNDILKVDINKLVEEENNGNPIKVVANLPYYITTPIIMKLFEARVPLKSITVMVQSEVAERMQVGPGTKDYGALSLAVQYYAKPEIIASAGPKCFIPAPKVGSSVIKLLRHENPPVEVKNEKLMFRIIRAVFNQRRKTMVNALNNSPEVPANKELVKVVLEKMEKSLTVRGETFTLEDFATFTNYLVEEIK